MQKLYGTKENGVSSPQWGSSPTGVKGLTRNRHDFPWRFFDPPASAGRAFVAGAPASSIGSLGSAAIEPLAILKNRPHCL